MKILLSINVPGVVAYAIRISASWGTDIVSSGQSSGVTTGWVAEPLQAWTRNIFGFP